MQPTTSTGTCTFPKTRWWRETIRGCQVTGVARSTIIRGFRALFIRSFTYSICSNCPTANVRQPHGVIIHTRVIHWKLHSTNISSPQLYLSPISLYVISPQSRLKLTILASDLNFLFSTDHYYIIIIFLILYIYKIYFRKPKYYQNLHKYTRCKIDNFPCHTKYISTITNLNML